MVHHKYQTNHLERIRGEHKIQICPPTDISESPTGPPGGLKRVSGEERLKNRVCVGLDGRARFLQIQNRVNRTRPTYNKIYSTFKHHLLIYYVDLLKHANFSLNLAMIYSDSYMSKSKV